MTDGIRPAASDPVAPAVEAKERALHGVLAGLGSGLIAFSGGVDSAYLAVAATRVLGNRALCVTADSPSYPAHHRELAQQIARDFHLHHEFVATTEVDQPAYRANPADRCYHCKQELFSRLSALARERGLAAMLDGNNADDRGDYRPGRQAAREHGVRSPLDEVGLAKAEIRELSRRLGLPTWDLPASACLSSRIPYGSTVTVEKLRRIDRAESALRALGFRHCRVRHHDDVARIELPPEELPRVLDAGVREAVVRDLKAVGYLYVSLDLEGYRTGSLNEGLPMRPL